MVAADRVLVTDGADDTDGDGLLTGVRVDKSPHLSSAVHPRRFGVETPCDEHLEEGSIIEESL